MDSASDRSADLDSSYSAEIQQTLPFHYDDGIVRKFVAATLFWSILAALAGLVAAVLMITPKIFEGQPLMGFGRLRPVHTNAAVFAFVGNAMFAAVYYSTQRLCSTRMWSTGLSQLHFWGWQAMIAASVITIPLGATQGKEYAEAQWPIDVAFAVLWIGCFGFNFAMTLSKRRQRHLYISLWFYIATIVVISVVHVLNNLVLPLGIGNSISIYSGVQDALIQWWYGHNLTMFFMTIPFLGLMYYFVPRASGQPVYSYRLAIIHFWSMVLIAIWAGPHHLHYTALPEWAASLGMLFAFMLWMPAWGGMLNGLKTLRSRPVDAASEPSLRFFFVGLLFYGVATMEGPLMSIKSINVMTHYTDVTIAHAHVASLGWNGMMIFGMLYWLTPRLFQTQLWSGKLVTFHFWISLAGVLIFVVPLYIAGWHQSLLLREIDDTGNLANFEFIETFKQIAGMYHHRALGGALFTIGLILMVWNILMTWFSRPSTYQSPSLQAPAEAARPAVVPTAASHLESAPVLNAAKKLDVVSQLQWHSRWEDSARRFAWIPLIAIVAAGLIELVPIIVAGAGVSTIETVKPYTPLELIGRDIYVREGCHNCHSQMVRPTVAETQRFGDYSLPGEFVYDRPFQWGSRRIGPDLAREGGLKSSLWHWRHLRDPGAETEGSVMPSFVHLLDTPLAFERATALVQSAQYVGDPYSDAELDGAEALARAQAESVAADIVSQGGPIYRRNLMTYQSQAVALIAYLQRLGIDRFAPSEPAPESEDGDAADVGPADNQDHEQDEA